MKRRLPRLRLLGAAAIIAAAVPVLAQTPLGYGPASPSSLPGSAFDALGDKGVDTDKVAMAEALKTGLASLDRGDVGAALAVREGLPEAAVERRILTWAVARSGRAGVTSGEIARAATELSAWPGTDQLRRNAERALLREDPGPNRVIGAFGTTRPLTIEGAIALARAHVALGQVDAAREAIVPLWRSEKLETSIETSVIREFGALIPAVDHRYRMERMLYLDRTASAMRIARLGEADELAAAWAAVVRGTGDAEALLDKVPPQQRGAGWTFAKAERLRKTGRFAEAATVMLAGTYTAEQLVDPDAWWIERRVLSRELIDIGDARRAYEVAAGHSAETPANAADAEFHAGWYALRFLSDPVAASKHFDRIARIADGAISKSRARYWMGRAAEAQGHKAEADAAFRAAAAFSSTFYGQLAAARIGEPASPPSAPQPSAEDRLRFEGREPVRAIRRLEELGERNRAMLLSRDLASTLETPGEVVLLAKEALQRGDHFAALRVAKAASARGLDVGSLSHPTGVIPEETALSEAGRALAYAIARQESEFNPGAVSGAGARGLLQLLPATAREMAQRTNQPWSQQRLTSDPGYNASLGTAFLSEQLDRFSGSYVLTFAGYNAGPRRATDWVRRYGDPRGKDIDEVVDWIERIPFAETRSYVQRVMENYQVYKQILDGRFDIASDLTSGR